MAMPNTIVKAATMTELRNQKGKSVSVSSVR